MGRDSRLSSSDWDSFTTTRTAGKTADQVFASKSLKKALDPKDIKLRESRDSDLNPASNAIIVGLDVTGSMGMIADNIARDGMKVLFTEIYDRQPVSDPHIMFMGIGDADYDRSPLQVSQFESSIVLADQLTDLHIEHGGGGNHHESYTMPWYFAAMRTSIDCFEKRQKKGYLFTVGDEEPPEVLSADQLRRVLGEGGQRDLSDAEVLAMVSRTYNVFHVVVEQGQHCRAYGADMVVRKWASVLGQHVLRLSDYTKLAEVVVSAIEVNEGRDSASVAASWSGDTSLVVARAVGNLPAVQVGAGGAVVAF